MRTEIAATDSAALYKNATTLSQPIVDHKQLQFIEAYNDERILVGACNLTGRFWNGSTWLYDDSASFEKSRAFVNFTAESCVSDGAFVERDKFVVVQDSGVLQVLQIVENLEARSKQIQCLGYTCQHDDGITSVATFDDKTRAVTGGMDRCIKVWNIGDLLSERSYEGAHRKTICCVDAKPKSNDVFASASLDCEAVIWDIRQDSPAQVVYSNPERQLQAVTWHPCDDNALVVGGVDGGIMLIDARKPRDFTKLSDVFKKPIHKMEFDPKRPNLLAACSEDNELKVLDMAKDFSVVYRDERHSDFVRGIAWYKDHLLSCSWDNTVLRHDILEESVRDT